MIFPSLRCICYDVRIPSACQPNVAPYRPRSSFNNYSDGYKPCIIFRAVLAVDKKEQAEVYNIYLRKAAEIYGVTRTRQIYEKAIEILSEAESRPMCLRFAEMETKLGEVDRARAIFTHASQMCDPR